MQCHSCRATITDNRRYCPRCGVTLKRDSETHKPTSKSTRCNYCGGGLKRHQRTCKHCGRDQDAIQTPREFDLPYERDPSQLEPASIKVDETYETSNLKDVLRPRPAYQLRRSRTLAAVLAFFLGGFGVHNFYLGRSGRGLAQLFLGTFGLLSFLFVVAWVWAWVEAVMLLLGIIRTDGYGRLLRF